MNQILSLPYLKHSTVAYHNIQHLLVGKAAWDQGYRSSSLYF